ncbi:hypothetical protein TNCV_2759621 [Trichonephila clavipes]|nr:hypothetical protein TNCV_2759621 [Trichonephila clavipes]
MFINEPTNLIPKFRVLVRSPEKNFLDIDERGNSAFSLPEVFTVSRPLERGEEKAGGTSASDSAKLNPPTTRKAFMIGGKHFIISPFTLYSSFLSIHRFQAKNLQKCASEVLCSRCHRKTSGRYSMRCPSCHVDAFDE